MLIFNGDDFTTDEAVITLRNYMWDMREDYRQNRNSHGFIAALLVIIGVINLYNGKYSFEFGGFILLVALESASFTLFAYSWANLWNTNKNLEVLQRELKKRNLVYPFNG